MPIPSFTGLPPNPQYNDIVIKVNLLVQELRNLLLSLDTLNVVELNAEVVVAGSITGDKIAANTITANKMDVDQLSAISANLGHITAGLIEAVEIFGSYISTANGTYPRIDFSSLGNLLAAYLNANQYIAIDPDATGGPTLLFIDSSIMGALSYTGGAVTLNTLLGSNLVFNSAADLDLRGDVKVNNGDPLGSINVSFSSAATVADLVNDYNDLISALKNMNVID